MRDRKILFKKNWDTILKVHFGETKTAPTECKEKGFQMISSACLHDSKHGKAP